MISDINYRIALINCKLNSIFSRILFIDILISEIFANIFPNITENNQRNAKTNVLIEELEALVFSGL